MVKAPVCPECGSASLYRDGFRYLADGTSIQRYLCRECGYRFSNGHNNSKNQRYNVRSDARQELKLLAEAKRQIESGQAGATATTQDVKGKIVEFLWYLQRMGRRRETIRQYSRVLKQVAKNVNILEPEEVKRFLADSKISRTSKTNLTYVFKSFYKFLKISWEPPGYKPEKNIPFIPTEQELDILISNGSKVVSAFLQILKDTGMRRGEALKLEWDNIDFERCVVRITAEKNSYPRVLPLSQTAITYLQRLPKRHSKVFNRTSVTTTFYRLRKRLAHKLQNPRLQKIGFHTFRHWKATMEYHKTKDILHVKEMLGHKSIQNTLIYINIERALFQKQSDEFHVKTAKTVEEAISFS
jgi:integrase